MQQRRPSRPVGARRPPHDPRRPACPAPERPGFWHAAEETEHKAVAFDVYRANRGGYLRRIQVMLVTTLIFFGLILRFQLRLVPGQPLRAAFRQIADAQRFLSRHVSWRELLRLYVAYFRPSFHPWELDNGALVTQWSASLPTTAPST